MTPRSTRLGWQIAVALLLVIAVLSLSIPPVRAAISAWLGLSVAPASQMPAPPVNLVAVSLSPGTGTPQAASTITSAAPADTAAPPQAGQAAAPTRPAEVSQLTSQAGWNILTAGYLPQGYKFQSAYYDTNNQMVILTYLVTRPLPGANDPSLTASHTLTLLQAKKDDFIPMQVAPSTNVEDVQVDGSPASYAVGAWDAQFVPDDSDPNGGRMVDTWRNDLKVQNLYWQAGDIYLVLVTDDETISKQELIEVANGVVK